MLATLLAIAWKEFRQVFRNRFVLRMTATFQITQLLLLGFIDLRARDLPLVICDQDQSSYSRELIQKISATGTFDHRFSTTSIAQAREHVRAGRAKVAVVIPPDFHRERASGTTGRVLALVDGSDSVATGQALAAIEGMTAQIEVNSQDRAPESITTRSMLLYNPEGNTSHFTLPALVAMVMANAYMVMAGIGLARERQMGTLERLLMTPLDFTGFILGKLTPYFVLALINASLLLLVMRWGFQVPVRGNLLLLGFSLAVFLGTSLGIGMFIAAGANSIPEVTGNTARISIPMLFLSGYLFPLTSLPIWLRPIAYALPATHMIEIMRGITLRDATFTDLWGHIAYLFVTAVIILTLAVQRFKARNS